MSKKNDVRRALREFGLSPKMADKYRSWTDAEKFANEVFLKYGKDKELVKNFFENTELSKRTFEVERYKADFGANLPAKKITKLINAEIKETKEQRGSIAGMFSKEEKEAIKREADRGNWGRAMKMITNDPKNQDREIHDLRKDRLLGKNRGKIKMTNAELKEMARLNKLLGGSHPTASLGYWAYVQMYVNGMTEKEALEWSRNQPKSTLDPNRYDISPTL